MWSFDGQWGEEREMGNGKSLGLARDKWGLGQGRNSEIGEDGTRYTRERIARGYQVVKVLQGMGRIEGWTAILGIGN
jgi:hypothetical protein